MGGEGGTVIDGLGQEYIEGPVHVVGVVQQQLGSGLPVDVLHVEGLAVHQIRHVR